MLSRKENTEPRVKQIVLIVNVLQYVKLILIQSELIATDWHYSSKLPHFAPSTR
jgi:hypothetical protein